MVKNIYEENGYKNRDHYLKEMSDQYGCDENTVFMISDLLGPTEDFDGLVTFLEDYNDGLYEM